MSKGCRILSAVLSVFLCLFLGVISLGIANLYPSAARRLDDKAPSTLGSLWNLKDALMGTGKPPQPPPASRKHAYGSVINNVTYMYVLGLDGSGVEDITSVVASIGRTCSQHVVFKNSYVKSSRYKGRATSFQSYMKSTKVSNYGPTKEVFVVEEGTFPSENVLVNSTYEQKKSNVRYNLEWIHDNLKTVGGVRQRYLYVHRDLYATAVSRPAQQDFEDQLYNLLDYTRYIDSEHNRISAKSAGLWGQMRYEWFTELNNCTALAAAIINFVGWQKCDVEFACEVIQLLRSARTTRNVTLVDEDNVELAALLAENTTIPTLALDLNAPSFSFQNVVSDRKYFTYGPHTNASAIARQYSPKQQVTHVRGSTTVDRWYNHTGMNGPARNEVAFVYVVGVEGTGHHGVTPAVASIAKTCGYHVIYENSGLRKAQAKFLPRTYRSALNSYRYMNYMKLKKVLILEDESFPTGGERRNSTMGEKKACGKYNLEWVHEQATSMGIDMKFLHLTRDFYKAVASHPEFDGTFERHAQVLRDFVWYIDAEYQRINAKQRGLWTTVKYEWFSEMPDCAALVSAVIDFAGWNDCDVEFACQVLRETLRNSTKRSVNETQYAYAQSMNVDISVPVLDISPDRNYSFRTAISERKPFSFIHNMTRRSRARSSLSGGLSTALNALTGHSAHNSNVSIVYVAGVRGAGHSMALEALGHVAKNCRYHVVSDSKALRRAQTKLLTRSYRAALSSLQHSVFRDTSKVVVLDGLPMYADGVRPTETSAQKRAHGKYNLAWLHGVAADIGVDIKFLYLNRSFAEVLKASYNFTVPLAVQAKSVHDFVHYIDEERTRIDEKAPGLWATLDYAMLMEPGRCTELVAALQRFARWDDCDMTRACSVVQARAHAERNKQHPHDPVWSTEEEAVVTQFADKVQLNITALGYPVP
jgi:hypothetical protein